uniref:Serpentine receptor class gamma n=1 Tax=Panagrellus redivivus TaxID=6233 RepID=A0A7E4ZZA3_PANRE
MMVFYLLPITVSWHNWFTKMMICRSEQDGMYSWNHSQRLSFWSSSRSTTVVFFVTLIPAFILNSYFFFTLDAFRSFAYEVLMKYQFYSMDVAMLVPAWSLLLTTYSNLDAIIWLSYSIPSYTLYILELLLINCKFFGNKKYRGSFYKIFTVNVIIQLTCNFGYFINFRAGAAPIFMHLYTAGYSFFSVFVSFVTYYATFYVLIGSLLMTFNRFTIFLLKHRYEEFWRRYLWPFIIVSLMLPCFLLWHIFLTQMSIIYQDGRGFTINHATKLSYWSSSRSGFIVFFATAPLALALNIYMCKQLMAQRLRKKGNDVAKKSDVQLFLVTIVTFVIQSCNSGIQNTPKSDFWILKPPIPTLKSRFFCLLRTSF